ncbi:MAG: MBL fold metallo-hydrolase [Anaerolineae bacterium]|nr:MBL fold metallo-hydrolase [Anaerolineae bacterium]
MFTIGSIEIHMIDTGVVWVDSGGPWGLVPRALWSRFLQPDDLHRVPMVLTSLLVRAGGKIILIDTGLGDKLDDKMRENWGLEHPHGTLTEGLARLDLTPADIDLVINTHLHGDHCAGNTEFTAEGGISAAFPNAEYVVQRGEYEDAMQPNERTRATYYPVNYTPLEQSGQLRLLDGDTEIVPGITGVVTPGHTDWHQSILFEDGDDKALFLSDLASYAVHFERLAWMTAYDTQPLLTLESKRKWQQWAVDTGALLIFQHDTQVLAGRMTENERGRRRVEPVKAAFV